jgi:hypothetical protein
MLLAGYGQGAIGAVQVLQPEIKAAGSAAAAAAACAAAAVIHAIGDRSELLGWAREQDRQGPGAITVRRPHIEWRNQS